VDGRVVLNWALKIVRAFNELIWLRIGTQDRSHGYGSESSGSIKGWYFLDESSIKLSRRAMFHENNQQSAFTLNVTCFCNVKQFVAQILYSTFRSMLLTAELLEREKCCSETHHKHDGGRFLCLLVRILFMRLCADYSYVLIWKLLVSSGWYTHSSGVTDGKSINSLESHYSDWNACFTPFYSVCNWMR
jgi:hypothetical protein